jgi:hypothetical protein
LVGKPERMRPLGRSSVDGRIILKWITGIHCLNVLIGFTWLRIETTGGLL